MLGTKLMRRTLAVGAVGAASAALMTSPATASQPQPDVLLRPDASCGATLNPSTSRSHAHWDVTCHNGEVTVSGYVQHDFGSGCSRVKAVFEGQITERSAASCGFWGGPKRTFSWTHPGSIADAYLYDY